MEEGQGTFSRTAAVVLLFALCAGGILLALWAILPVEGDSAGIAPTILIFGPSGDEECISGATSECKTDGGCEGERVCMHGFWSGCFVRDECTPGEERFCNALGCTSGVQKCNECGQWGECGPG
jgi:hypothetical protein